MTISKAQPSPPIPSPAAWAKGASWRKRSSTISVNLGRIVGRSRGAGPCGAHFGDQLRRALLIAGRKVERHDGLRADPARDLARVARRQVILARRMVRVLVEKYAFDEKQVHARQQPEDRKST